MSIKKIPRLIRAVMSIFMYLSYCFKNYRHWTTNHLRTFEDPPAVWFQVATYSLKSSWFDFNEK